MLSPCDLDISFILLDLTQHFFEHLIIEQQRHVGVSRIAGQELDVTLAESLGEFAGDVSPDSLEVLELVPVPLHEGAQGLEGLGRRAPEVDRRGLVEVAHRQPHDVLFDPPAHVGDRLLRGRNLWLARIVGCVRTSL